MSDSAIASCTHTGIITGMELGRSYIIGRVVGIDRQTGMQRIYSQDKIHVHVVLLSAIRIHLPLKRVRQNSEIPVYVTGVDLHQTPLCLATCQPNLRFYWSLSDNQSGRLYNSLRWSGLNPWPSLNHFSLRFQALRPGHTVLRVRVSADSESRQLNDQELYDEVTIHVYESLQLAAPVNSAGKEDFVLLMMAKTELNLKTNLDPSAVVEYSIDGPTKLVMLDGKGGLSSGSNFGQTPLIITAKNQERVAQSIGVLVEVSVNICHNRE